MSLASSVALGIDVSKSFLDVGFSDRHQTRRFDNDPEGLVALQDWLSEVRPTIIAIEASGGFEAACARFLESRGWPLAVVNPARVRAYAKACGILAKTDRIDAILLARFALGVNLQPRRSKAPELRELEAWLVRRAQVVQMQIAEHNRRLMATGAVARAVDRLLRAFEREIGRIDRQIAAGLQDMVQAQGKIRLMATLRGVGTQTRAWLIAALPELGTLSRTRIAALVGVAPFAKDSGKFHGKRSIAGGRSTVRTALYMATLSAVRWEPGLRDYYQALLARGKAKKVALIASARKLLTILNAILRDATPYQARQPKPA